MLAKGHQVLKWRWPFKAVGCQSAGDSGAPLITTSRPLGGLFFATNEITKECAPIAFDASFPTTASAQ